MTGYYFAMSNCAACGGIVFYNPDLVPNLQGVPICPRCLVGVILTRRRRGLAVITWVHPDAYGPAGEDGSTQSFEEPFDVKMITPPENCQRCGGPLHGVNCGSYFNTQVICQHCKDEEAQAPGYARAVAAENAQVQAGNYNYPGVGLSDADSRFLAQLRKQRTEAPSE